MSTLKSSNGLVTFNIPMGSQVQKPEVKKKPTKNDGPQGLKDMFSGIHV